MLEAAQDDPHWPDGAERLFTPAEVARALDAQARRLDQITRPGEVLSIVTLMNGGMYPAIELGRRLSSALRIDYVH
ncbi:MAG TPA: hypothetical protein VK972_10905, partial [Wenzhouxiangella sp.]|nr:hypothetical protein [Wenzhouxiangella sp.]